MCMCASKHLREIMSVEIGQSKSEIASENVRLTQSVHFYYRDCMRKTCFVFKQERKCNEDENCCEHNIWELTKQQIRIFCFKEISYYKHGLNAEVGRGVHSTEVAFQLPTQRARVWFSAVRRNSILVLNRHLL